MLLVREGDCLEEDTLTGARDLVELVRAPEQEHERDVVVETLRDV